MSEKKHNYITTCKELCEKNSNEKFVDFTPPLEYCNETKLAFTGTDKGEVKIWGIINSTVPEAPSQVLDLSAISKTACEISCIYWNLEESLLFVGANTALIYVF